MNTGSTNTVPTGTGSTNTVPTGTGSTNTVPAQDGSKTSRPSHEPTNPAADARRRVLATLGCLLVGLLCLAATGDGGEAEATAALAEGNRLFREGQLEDAAETYRRGYAPGAPHPTLVYNLGATLHQLDRLPEAILWYRRAPDSQDPWLEENLWLARRSLGSQSLPAAGLLGNLATHAGALRWLAVGLAWLGLGWLLVASQRLGLWPGIAAAGLSLTLYFGAWALDRWGPHPAVLLEDCATQSGDLPAGTEAWVRPAIEGGWHVSGAQGVCPPSSVARVFPVH